MININKKFEECHITSAEWQIMKVVWANGEVTSKFVSEVLCEKMDWKKATIKTLLNRLLEKGILCKKEVGNKYIYYTMYKEEEITKNSVMEPFNKICKTKVGKFIGEVIEESLLSYEDIDLLIKILEKKKKDAVIEVPCDCLKGQCNCHQHNNEEECCNENK